MSLSQTVQSRVSARAPFREQLEQVIASEGGVTVRCELSGADALGCAITQLQLVAESPRSLTMDELAAHADRICEKVTYLLEPLRCVEVDRQARLALLRSRQPKQKEKQLGYYELLLSADQTASLRRYSYDRGARKRTAVPLILTLDQLEMLVDDLVAALGVEPE
jgi:hypothetical protein